MRSIHPSSTLPFSKMHGAGNDFVLLDLRNAEFPSPELCRALADRHTGVGCDLILGITRPRSVEAVASFAIWTADGLPSQQCGNGARCVAAWVLRAGLAQGPQFALDSPTGTHTVDVLDAHSFTIDMGVPQFTPAEIPLFGFDEQQDRYEVDLDDGSELRFSAVSLGNPHAVLEVDDVDAAPIDEVGAALQKSRFFRPTVNIGFVEVVSRDRVRLRVHEYGAGETLACGSGACAAAASLMRQGRVESSISVALPGGELHVNWPDTSGRIYLSGPAAFAYEGRFPHASP